MEHLSLPKGRRIAEAWLDDHMQDAVSAAAEDERRLLKTLYTRQKGSLEYLSLIQLDMGKPAAHQEDESAPLWLTALAHPLVDILMPVVVLAFVLLDWDLAAVISAILATLRGLLRATHPALRSREVPIVPEVHEPYLLESDLTRFLQQQTDRIAIDAASIAERQAVTLIRERQDVGEDAVELYCALYEAALDIPDREALAYPLSILKMSLLERGLEPVEYTPGSSALFDVMPADCPGEMRWPAIRSRDNGAIHKRGLYLCRPQL